MGNKVRIAVLEARLEEREKQVAIALASRDKAIEKFEAGQRAVNATQNEFRGALKDQAATLATRSEVDRILERVQSLEKGAASGVGKSQGVGALVALLISLAALAAAFWKK